MPYNQDDNYLQELDNKLSSGKKTSECAPFTIEDKVKVIIKIRTSFDEREVNILNTYCSSRRNREYTLSQYNISKTTLYRLLEKVNGIFERDSSPASAGSE